MAHAETSAFSDLNEAKFTTKSGLELQEDLSMYGSRDGRANKGVLAGQRPHSDGHRRSKPSRSWNFEEEEEQQQQQHNCTPPISVPYNDDRHHTPPAVVEEIEYSHNPRYEKPSPLEQFVRNRRPSISFNPEVTLDCGVHLALEEPLRKWGDRTTYDGAKPPAASSELHRLYTDSRDEHELESDDEHHHHDNAREIPHSPMSDNISVDAELPRPISLTSLSTASPLTEELRTPPEPRRDIFLSSFHSSPALHRPNSLDDGESWPGMERHAFGKGSYNMDRKSSLRHVMGPRRRKSPSSSGKSPASAFLSTWHRDEPPPEPDDEGQVVGSEYVLGKQIGFGGFSTVKEAFKVKDDGDTERFAVKIVKRNLSDKSERENDQVQAAFEHEVRIWRYLNHPNVLPLDAVYETDYATFCFTRLTTGGTLYDLVRKHRHSLHLDQAKRFTYQLASAIRYLHEDARVVHRDIKLENCLLEPKTSEDGVDTSELILCDFGMAEWMETDTYSSSPDPYENPADRPPPKNIGPSVTSTSVAGSLEYASPELLMSTNGILDPVVDIWALGVVAYTLVVGSRPFQHPFQPRVQMNILGGNWDRNAVLNGETDSQDRLDALELIEGCLEMDPIKRWTISEVLASPWFRGCMDNADSPSPHSQWGF